MEVAVVVAFFGWILYVHFKEKSQSEMKRAIKWEKESQRIRNLDFENSLDKEYCQKYIELQDPRIDKGYREILRGQWLEVIERRKAAGLPEHCGEVKSI